MIRSTLSAVRSALNLILAPRRTAQVLAVTLSSALVITSAVEPARAGLAAAPQLPEFVKALKPSPQLGYLENYFQGQTKNPVVLIQDLHCNYGVQKKIAGLLKFLQPKVTSADKPMVVGIEAAWKDIDTGYGRKYDAAIRDKAGNALMKLAEMKGTEYFAMTSDKPVQLTGIDEETRYAVHRTLVQKSASVRLRLAHKLDEMQTALAESKDSAPRTLKKVWQAEEKFENANPETIAGIKKFGNWLKKFSLRTMVFALKFCAYLLFSIILLIFFETIGIYGNTIPKAKIEETRFYFLIAGFFLDLAFEVTDNYFKNKKATKRLYEQKSNL